MIMIKKQWIWAIWAIGMLSACNNEDNFTPDAPQPVSGAIELTVSAGDFVTNGAPDTRATDNGAATTFESGDRVGVIILDGSNNILSNNIPYKYNGGGWTFDSSNGEGKSQCYYDYKATTYIVYYPYSASANGATSENDLKGKFVPKENQQSKDDYRSSDLMVWTATSNNPLKVLSAELEHAYASISLSLELRCMLNDGNSTQINLPSSRLSDINLTIDDNIYYPFQSEDGSFRCILPADISGTVRCFYTLGDKTYGNTLNITSATANTRYVSAQEIDAGTYSLDKAQVGDFYCKNSSDEGYLIPGEVASLTDGQQAACLGVVYWVGDPTNDANGDPLLKKDKSDCTHGLVVALHDAGENSLWSTNYEYITGNWLNSQSTTYGITTLKEQNKMQGYANTKALEGYNASDRVSGNSNLKVLPVGIIAEYADTHSAPTGSSDWYWPSIMELKYMCWGLGNSSGTGGRNMLNTQFGKVQGAASLQSYFGWSSTEDDGYGAWSVYFYNGDVYRSSKIYDYFWVRAVLAF